MRVFKDQRQYSKTIYKGFLYQILILLCFFISCAELHSQCTNASIISIPDNGTTTFQFSVTGLIDNNLSSPTQGICGVEIEFMHEYLGDLTVTLVSPNGTTVGLIGPPTTTINPTNLSVWNIDFVPCMTPASPDPGFTDAWSNLQSWQALTPYTGTYHPQSGCLENFNTGPANGLWQIIIQDHDQFQVGTIASVTLLFCNPTGLNCIECGANAGVLSPSSFAICSGENIQSTDIAIDFGGNTPSPALYSYIYLLVSGNTILQYGNNFSITPAVGNYTLCGMSYLSSDAPIINGLLAANDYNTLSQAISSGVVCADLTATCVPLTVTSRPDTLIIASSICNGEVFSFRGQNYFSDGLFYQVYDGPGLCDTVYEIRINARTLNVALVVPDTLTCGSGNVVLSASASGAAGPFIFQWSTFSGNITSPSIGPSVTVDQAGQYFVAVTDGICDGAGSVHVYADQGFPQVFVDGGTITCNEPTMSLSPVFVPTNGVVQWTGPGGFSSSRPDTFVNVPGTYVISVTNNTGCTTSRAVDIGIDTLTQNVVVVSQIKNCQAGFLTIGYETTGPVINQRWIGPNNFISGSANPNISDAGLYTLSVTFPNGCQRSAFFFFDGDFVIPDVTVPSDDTLNCNEVLTLTVSSTTSGASYSWNGPLNLFVPLSTIQVIQEGTYHGTVIAPNGCRNSEMVVIERGNDLFDFQTYTDTLTCTFPVVEIGVVSVEADVYKWVNFSGPDSLQSSIMVGSTGLYMVMMTDTTTGCTVTGNIQVTADVGVPVYSFITDTISCNAPIATLNFISVAGHQYLDVEWELLDQSKVHSSSINVTAPGQYFLRVTGQNGCLGISGLTVPADTIPPLFFIEADTLDCQRTGMLRSIPVDSVVQITWTGPVSFFSNASNPMIMEAGLYEARAIGLNGCEGLLSIEVLGDFAPPEGLLSADSLTCLFIDASLHVSSPDSILSYTWRDGNGIIIGSDSIVLVNSPGLYTVSLEGKNHCLSVDTLFIDPLVYPDLQFLSDTLTCADTIAQVEALTSLQDAQFAWFDLNGMLLSILSVVDVYGFNPVILTITGQNGCEARDTIFSPVDTMPPMPYIDLLGEVLCQNRDFMLDGSVSSPFPLLYSWSTIGGTILSDVTQSAIQARDTGIYYLTIQRLDNGCLKSDSFHVTENPDAITLAFLDITSPECNGNSNAAIEITNLEGGIGPFLYEMNGGAPQTNTYFDGLSAGNYLLTITDAENCQFDTMVIIDDVIPFTVDAGPDLEIYLGESINLTGLTDLPVPDILISQWDSMGVSLCTDCLTFDVSPLETTTYDFQITSASGCLQSDQVVVFVVEKAKYYLANIFSPNGDGINDEVRLNPSPGISKVLQWVIFDRWGNAVFGRTNFDPGDPSVFWNGQTTTGEFANPGVFPYVLEVELINGRKEVYHGDITLLR